SVPQSLMDERDVVRDLVAKLIEAVEASLDGSPAVRDALDELVRNGFEPRLILLRAALAGSPAVRDALDELVRNGCEPRLILLADATARSSSGDESADDEDASGT